MTSQKPAIYDVKKPNCQQVFCGWIPNVLTESEAQYFQHPKCLFTQEYAMRPLTIIKCNLFYNTVCKNG